MAINVNALGVGIYTVIVDRVELEQLKEITHKRHIVFSSKLIKEIIASGIALLYDTYKAN